MHEACLTQAYCPGQRRSSATEAYGTLPGKLLAKGLEVDLDQDFLLDALLQHNFLPNNNQHGEELPPVFSSHSFSKSTAEKLVNDRSSRPRAYQGYDAVQYKSTRFNGVSRILSIPHPKAYASLALCIHRNWDGLKYVSENENSKVRPERHADGRITIMNYEDRLVRAQDSLEFSFGRRFLAHTDLSNFYPSVYSHSIPWALVGFAEAKKNKEQEKWYNKLDQATRMTKRNETQGLAIGPATSHILSEAILARIDEKLRSKFDYFRFIDDYTAYCKSEEEAQDFILALAKELDAYKLTLNIGKTAISSLPRAQVAEWITELGIALPSKSQDVTTFDAMKYLDLAVKLSKQSPDGSVLKYAMRSLLAQNLEAGSLTIVLRYALNLSFHQPVLLPMLERLFHLARKQGWLIHHVGLPTLVKENVRFGRSDMISWALYFCNLYQVPVPKDCVKSIVESGDCLPLLLLYLSGDTNSQKEVVSFTNNLNKDDLYTLDQYWLLLYQLFLDGKVNNPYLNDRSFEIMQEESVNFVETAGPEL